MPSTEFCQKNWMALFSGRNIFIIKITFLHFISPSSSSSLLHAFACVRLKQTIKNRKGATRKGYPPERGTFFRLQVHERVENSLVEVKRELAHYLLLKYMSGVGREICDCRLWKDIKGRILWLWKRQVSVLVVHSYLKDDAFIITVLKRNRQGSKLLCEKGIICQ